MTRKLNLGSGNRKREDWINIDINSNNNPDIVRDISKGLPFDDDSVDEIYISHVIEHLKWEDFFFVMSEMHRVCKKGAQLQIIVPSPTFIEGAFDIDHRIVINKRSFQIYDRNFSGCQDYTKFNYNRFWTIISIEDDKEGKKGEPQLYITLQK